MSGWYWLLLGGAYGAILVVGIALARTAKRGEEQRQYDEHLARLQRARRAESRNGGVEFEWPAR